MTNPDTTSTHHAAIRHLFEVHGEEYLQKNRCDRETIKAIYDIASCRTELQGGHLLECDYCHTLHYQYNSCHNRNCPICHHLDEFVYVEELKQRAVNIPHYEITLKLPNCLYRFAQQYKKLIYKAQMDAAKQLIKEIDIRNQYQSGSVTILHTWSEHLLSFVHNHILMTQGGLSITNQEWITNHNDCPLELELLNHLYLNHLAKHISQIPATDLGLTSEGLTALSQRVRQAKRRVWCKTVDEHLPQAFHYLGKFRFGVGVKENQLQIIDQEWVELKSNRGTSYRLTHEKFIQRFVNHILPENFQKVRHYGLYANASGKNLTIAKKLCYQATNRNDLIHIDITRADPWEMKIAMCYEINPRTCHYCKIGQFKYIGSLEKGQRTANYKWENRNRWIIPEQQRLIGMPKDNSDRQHQTS